MHQHNRFILFFCLIFALEGTLACKDSLGLKHYGTQQMPGTSCADILKQRCDHLRDGIYWIALGQTKPFPVFCNMEAGGWTLVFKVIAGVSGRPSTTWNLPFPTYEYSLDALNKNNYFKHHYKNRIVQNWGRFKPTEARVVMYKRRKEQVVIMFNAVNSNNKNWFSQAKIIESPWQDILTERKNYFSIVGPCHRTGCRDFFINRQYGGCGNDAGWLYVGDAVDCKWESRLRTAGVKLLYSNQATYVNYNTYNKVGVADVFAVYVR